MDANILGTQITVGAITVAFINWLKTTSIFPSFVRGKTWLVRSVSLVISFAAGLGIHTAWTPAPDGTHTLAITGLALMPILGSLWVVIKQYAITELAYHGTKPASNPQLVAALAPAVAEQEKLIPPKEPVIGKGTV